MWASVHENTQLEAVQYIFLSQFITTYYIMTDLESFPTRGGKAAHCNGTNFEQVSLPNQGLLL